MIRLAAVFCFCAASAQNSAAVNVHVTLERSVNGRWSAVDPHLVLRGGDEVRFRFRSNRAGFLYVVNHDASGHDSWLFPTPDTGEQNAIEPDRDYLIPGNSGVFQIAARAGYETTYWILSPEEMRSRRSLPEAAVKSDETPLLPRCGNGSLVARGDCNDRNGGARRAEVGSAERWFENGDKLVARDLDVENHGSQSRIRVTRAFDAPFIYEFRIAHGQSTR